MRRKQLFILLIITTLGFNLKSQTPLTTSVDFNVTDINNFQYNLFTILNSNKTVILYFFTGGNPGSQDSVSFVNQSYIDYGCNDGNVVFLGINFGEDENDVENFSTTYGVDFPLISGIDGGGNQVIADYQIALNAYPTAILIESNKNISEQDLVIISMTPTISSYGGISQPCIELVADFTSSLNSFILVNGTIDFTDLSTPTPDFWEWTFEGGIPSTSSDQNPTVQYPVSGDFTVKLKVLKTYHVDSVIKEQIIHVVDSGAPVPLFFASDSSIMEEDTVFFTDSSTFAPTQWEWVFEGGDPPHYSGQNPPPVIYHNAGTFDVSLTVINSHGYNYLLKEDYIKVSELPPEPEICDTISNLELWDSLMTVEVEPWGYLPGHNGLGIKEYADLHINSEGYNYINGFLVAVAKVQAGQSSSKVRFKVWDGDSIPGTILAYKDVILSQLTANFYYFLIFEEEVPISGNFFVGYEIFDINGDQFAVSMAKNRGDSTFNSVFVKYSSDWYQLSELEILGNISSSLALKPIACKNLTDIETINNELSVSVFPNPAKDEINILLSENDPHAVFQIFDINGRQIQFESVKKSENSFQINVSELKNGLYFLNVILKNKHFSSRIVILK